MWSQTKRSSADDQVEALLTMFRSFDVEMELGEVKEGRNALHILLKSKKPVRMQALKDFEDDACYALGVRNVEIEAPVPATSFIGITIPKEVPTQPLTWKEAVALESYQQSDDPLSVVLGKDEFDEDVTVNIHTLPHLLVSGVPGSGKSALLHVILTTLISRCKPERVRFILVDETHVEFNPYNGAPHLLTPVIADAKKMILALKWLNKEMDKRFEILRNAKVSDIESYYLNVVEPALKSEESEHPDGMPYIVVVIDELSDAMCQFPRELEAPIVRLTQSGAAVGIHVIISTSRPSAKIITGPMKANIPSRIAFHMATAADSRSILTKSGAEKLRPAADALFLTAHADRPIRLQPVHITEEDVRGNVEAIKVQSSDEIDFSDQRKGGRPAPIFSSSLEDVGGDDELYADAKSAVLEVGKASTSYLQRKMGIGYARAARLIDLLEESGVIGPADGAAPRPVIDHDTN